MAIEPLLSLISPPEIPRDTAGDWLAAEKQLGITYPNDFREMIGRYGTGEFFNSLVIDNPLTENGRTRLHKHLDNLRVSRDAMELSWMIHPEPHGLFPWGRDHKGHQFCWQSEGRPDEWHVVQIAHNDDDNLHHANANLTTFLVQFADNNCPEMGGIPPQKDQVCFSVGLPWDR